MLGVPITLATISLEYELVLSKRWTWDCWDGAETYNVESYFVLLGLCSFNHG